LEEMAENEAPPYVPSFPVSYQPPKVPASSEPYNSGKVVLTSLSPPASSFSASSFVQQPGSMTTIPHNPNLLPVAEPPKQTRTDTGVLTMVDEDSFGPRGRFESEEYTPVAPSKKPAPAFAVDLTALR